MAQIADVATNDAAGLSLTQYAVLAIAPQFAPNNVTGANSPSRATGSTDLSVFRSSAHTAEGDEATLNGTATITSADNDVDEKRAAKRESSAHAAASDERKKTRALWKRALCLQ